MDQQILNQVLQNLQHQTTTKILTDMRDKDAYSVHEGIFMECARLRMESQFKPFVVDNDNRDVLRFLLYYFNNSPMALEVFPEKKYQLGKNIMLCGNVGAGKSMLMQVLSDYLKVTRNPNYFENLSVSQMINYYKLHNHLDRYTYNEESSTRFEGNPINICLNDVGLTSHSQTFYGTDTKLMIDEVFHARNEIWMNSRKYCHITTNLTPSDLKAYFSDDYGRLVDRFKTYNVVHLKGESRRK